MITRLFLLVLEASLSISLIIAALVLFSSLLNRRYAVKWKYWIWIFLAVRLLIPFSGGDEASDVEIINLASTKAVKPAADNVWGDNIIPQQIIIEIPTYMAASVLPYSGENHEDITLLDVVSFVWMTVCVMFIAIHLFSYIHYKWMVRNRGRIKEDSHVRKQLSHLKEELKIRQKMSLAVYAKADGPMMIGLFRPILVLPEQQYSAEELYFVLKHELVHMKRHDILFKLLMVAANAVHWFNPLVWIMRSKAFVDMEMSCDEKVVQNAAYSIRKAYTETLLSTIYKTTNKRAVLSTQFSGGKQIMKKRFENILLGADKKDGLFLLIGAVILTISLGSWIGCSVAGASYMPEKEDESFAYNGQMVTVGNQESYAADRAESIIYLDNSENIDCVRKGLMHNAFVDIQNAYAVYAFAENTYLVEYTVDGGDTWNELVIACSGPLEDENGEPAYLWGKYPWMDDEIADCTRLMVKYGEFPDTYNAGKYFIYSDLRAGRRN
ncbi:MAG: M56 family metallopeptidase [Acetatifactor sp.]|nr:M56 family metallopeptidase [Acetatifactor sp.]